MSGYKVVPVEPTPEMLEAYCGAQPSNIAVYLSDAVEPYKAMLAAAPSVQGEPVAGGALHPSQVRALRRNVKRNCPPEIYALLDQAITAPQQPDPFRGDNAALIRSAQSLLSLDDKGAFGPNGIGGHARNIITAFIARISAEQQPAPDVAGLVEALEGLLGVTGESRGVSGFHLNGEIAEWDEFQEVHDASAALATYRKQGGEA